jgi:hypothetical protein
MVEHPPWDGPSIVSFRPVLLRDKREEPKRQQGSDYSNSITDGLD